MQVEFYEDDLVGKQKTVTKLHIKKTVQRQVKVMQAADAVVRTATEQDKVQFKAEYDAFLASKKISKQQPKTK